MSARGWTNAAPEEGAPRWRRAASSRLLGRGRAREPSLVPPATMSARSLVMVIAIMSFLASVAGGCAVLVGRASRGWSEAVAREASVQVRARPGVDLDKEVGRVAALLRATPGVLGLHPFSRAESERMLEPWLGGNLNFDDLPVPRLIVLDLDPQKPDAAGRVRAALASVPGASFDDHRAWSERLATMGRALVGMAVAALLLILGALALAVAFATRGAMAGSREVVEVLHLVGATDGYVGRQYGRRFLRFGLTGGLAGAVAACLGFSLVGRVSRGWTATAGGAQVEALFGSFALGLEGYALIATTALFTAAVVTLTARWIVARQLRALF